MIKYVPSLVALALMTTSCQSQVPPPAAQPDAKAPVVQQDADAKAPEVKVRSIPLDCGGWLSGFSIHSSGRLYAYGDVFGLWRSDDAGQSWKYLLNDFTNNDYFVSGSAVSTKDADTVVFVTERNLYKSTDGGATWKTQLDRINQSRTRGATPIIFQPGSTTEMWLAATRNRETGWLWHTTDGGETWSKVAGNTFDNVAVTTTYVHPKFPDQIWVGAVGGLFVSADHGKTFTNVWDNNGGSRSPMGYRPTVTSIARRSDGIGYFASNISGYQVTATDYNDPKTYKVTKVVDRMHGQGPVSATVLADDSFVTMHQDGGFARHSRDGSPDTWVELPMKLDPKNTPIYLVPKADAKAPGGRDMVVQDPTKPSRWFMTGGKAPVITEDSGATWNFPPRASGMAGVMVDGKISFPRANPKIALISVADQGVFVVNDAGMSGNAAYSSRTSMDKHAIFHYTMASDDGQTLVAAGCDQTANKNMIYRSTNGGKDWTELDLTNAGLPASDEGIIQSINAPGSTTDFLVILGFRGDRKNNNPGVYRTTDGGVTFKKAVGIPDGIDTGHRYAPGLSHLDADGKDANARYLTMRSPNNEAARGFYRSTDGGSTWAKTAGQPFGNSMITDLAADPSTAGQVWVSVKKGVSRSENGGDTWTTVSDFTIAENISAVKGCVAVWGRRPGDEWNKLYYSADNGTNWVEATGPGRRFGYLRNVTVNPNKTNELWISGISVNILTVDVPAVRTAGR